MEKLAGIVIGFFVLSVVFAVLERLFAAKPEQKILRSGYKTDLVYWFFTPLVSKAVASLSAGLLVAVMFQVRPRDVKEYILMRETWICN